ncbi:MAG TPA: T9SS type A sorting domain-containing protein, partial [Puia sp.]|nr:T9SS type A sorting domain-containing protein [Puia sp.]
YTNTRIENDGLGYLPLNPDNPRFLVDRPQGVILSTGGNINAELISTSERWQDSKGVISNYHLHGYYRLNEIYDSIPYELCTDLDHPYQAYRPILPDNAIPTDTLIAGPDSLIAHTLDRQPENYWLAGSGNKVWATVMGPDAGTYSVYLQELKLVSAGTKKYTFVINTADKLGLKIGQEIPTGDYTSMVTYNTPAIATDDNGHALFYVMESSRSARVSPIGEGGLLSWGAMGKAISSGYWARRELGSQYPMAVLSNDGKGLIAWDNLRYDDVNTSRNIFMERITDVFTPAYEPPLHTLSLLTTSGSSSIPAYFTGGTNVWTTIDGLVFNFNSGGNNVTTPMVSLKDTYPMGFVKLSTYEWASAVRLTNGVPYLNRNFTITVDNNPNGSGNIPMRFYIPQAMFDALKAADPGISGPGDLGIIDQPSAGATAPSAYMPTGNEQMLSLTGWGAIDGGYYIEFIAKGFSNFFITRGVAPLPLKWLDLQGSLTAPTAAAISWTVTEEKNVKGYTVQYSSDGVNYMDGCTTGSGNSGVTTSYSCTVPLPAAGTYSFRVKQEDIDGKFSYSKLVVLRSAAPDVFSVSPNPTSSFAVLRIPGGSVVKKLTLLSISGKSVWQTTGALSGGVTIPMGQLPAGVYHLQVMEDSDVRVLKIIKK